MTARRLTAGAGRVAGGPHRASARRRYGIGQTCVARLVATRRRDASPGRVERCVLLDDPRGDALGGARHCVHPIRRTSPIRVGQKREEQN